MPKSSYRNDCRYGNVFLETIPKASAWTSTNRLYWPVKGPELIVGDALTIEPGLYNKSLGGVRIEDMVIVTEDGCENLNLLQQGLEWA